MNGKEILDLGNTKKGQRYVLGALAPKDQPNYNGPWDCAEFVSYLVYQVSHKLYGCFNNNSKPATADAYTGYWKRDAELSGKIVSVEEAARTPGAAVLRVAAQDRIGHIVISDGKGGTIEANGTKTGVINAALSGRRWDYGVLVPWISYDPLAPQVVVPVAPPVYRYTHPMMVSEKVGEIQRALKNAGFDPNGIDNIYGGDTARAVEAFQEEKGVVSDGEVGPVTAALLGISLK